MVDNARQGLEMEEESFESSLDQYLHLEPVQSR